MAPKIPTRKRSQPSNKAASKERRSKYNEDGLSRKRKAVEEPSSPPATSRKIPSMGMRQVVSGRCIPVNFLEDLELELGDKLEEQGWSDFCALNIRTYPNLVRTFYENLVVGEEHIESRVKGKRIIISEESLSKLLQIPHTGDKFLQLESREEALKLILGREDVNAVGNIVASSLPLEMRLLHNIISRIFIPRTGRFDWVSERDLAFMERIIKEEPINLPYIMLGQMKDTTRKANTCLPYGMVFTLVFEASHVNLEGEDSRQLHHTETYSTKSLNRMGYQLTNDQWVKKVSKQNIETSSNEDEEDLEERHQNIQIEGPELEVPPTYDSTAPSLDMQQDTDLPSMETPAPSFPEPAAAGPTISPTLLEQQMKQLTDNLMTSMSSMFEQLNQSVEAKFQILREELNQLKGRLDLHDLTIATPHTSPAPSTSTLNAISADIKSVLNKGIDKLSSEVKVQASRVDKLEDCQSFENNYASNLGILRGEFGRLRGAAESVAKSQAQESQKLQDKLKDVKSSLDNVCIHLHALQVDIRLSHPSACFVPPTQPAPHLKKKKTKGKSRLIIHDSSSDKD